MAEPKTIQQQLAEEQEQIAALTDTTEAALRTACLRHKAASFKGEDGASAQLLKAQNALNEYLAKRDAAPAGERFAKLDSAVEPCVLSYLRARGWSLQKSKLSADAKAGKLVKRGGYYHAAEIDVYARTWCKPSDTQEPAKPSDHKEEILRETARKLRVQNEEREGTLIPRPEVEQGLARRLAFLKQDLSNFGPFMVDRFIEAAAAHLRQCPDPDSINLQSIAPDLVDLYDTKLEAWLDRYVQHQ